MTETPESGPIRLDKWLFHARFAKTRSLAAARIKAGEIRLNGVPVAKPSVQVRPGDVLTFAQGDWVRIVEIRAPGTRRGPAPEAQTLYDDRSPPRPERPVRAEVPGAGEAGRPTKKDRRDRAAFTARSERLE